MSAKSITLTQFVRHCRADFVPSVWIHFNLYRYQVIAIFPPQVPSTEYHLLTFSPDAGIITTYRVTDPDSCILHIYPIEKELDLK